MIPQTALVVAGPFGAELSAEDVARAIGRGLVAGGRAAPDICPIDLEQRAQTDDHSQIASGRVRGARRQVDAPEVAALLADLDFDARMRSARAVVLAEERLRESALRGSVAFEIATRARQGGVPAYAVTAENALEPFDARILDLQVILEAGNERTLVAAGTKLARIVDPR